MNHPLRLIFTEASVFGRTADNQKMLRIRLIKRKQSLPPKGATRIFVFFSFKSEKKSEGGSLNLNKKTSLEKMHSSYQQLKGTV